MMAFEDGRVVEGERARPRAASSSGLCRSALRRAATVSVRRAGRRGWALSQYSFEKLLLALDSDRGRAGEKYQAIRAKLIRLFEWRGCSSPEALADETIDRVARRIAEGIRIRAGDPTVYFFGVARNVLKEYWTERGRERALRASVFPDREPSAKTDSLEGREMEERLDRLDGCLGRLSLQNRRLITVYYRSEKSGRIAERLALAKSLGLSPGALRIRAHRIRRTLEAWVRESMRAASDA